MAWTDRIREAAYNSPSGIRLTFVYEDVSREFDKKTSAFNFPDASGTYIQDLGPTGRRYPLRFIFWGEDYDLAADAFELALAEPGIGSLEHPKYGVVPVVPFGRINRRDELKTAANQAIIETTLWETITEVYPLSQVDPAASIRAAVVAYNAAASEQLDDGLDLTTVGDQVFFRNSYSVLLSEAKSGLQSIADAQEDTRRQFDSIVRSIENSIGVLVADPISLAFQTSLLIQSPAQVQAGISDRLTAYGDLTSSILSGNGADVSQQTAQRTELSFRADDLYASGYVTGAALSVANATFKTKPSAIQAADDLISQFDSVVDWRDDNFGALNIIDTGGAYQQLHRAVMLAASFLIELSFTLKQERRIRLDRARTILDLSAELYGEVDPQLDFLITSNNLSGSEIWELPRGREIVYYI
jgi:prophage DNA circulation protein